MSDNTTPIADDSSDDYIFPGVQAMADRIRTNPEDFDYGGRFQHYQSALNALVYRQDSGDQWPKIMSKAELTLLRTAWRTRLRRQISDEVMDRLLNPEKFTAGAAIMGMDMGSVYKHPGSRYGLAQGAIGGISNAYNMHGFEEQQRIEYEKLRAQMDNEAMQRKKIQLAMPSAEEAAHMGLLQSAATPRMSMEEVEKSLESAGMKNAIKKLFK